MIILKKKEGIFSRATIDFKKSHKRPGVDLENFAWGANIIKIFFEGLEYIKYTYSYEKL